MDQSRRKRNQARNRRCRRQTLNECSGRHEVPEADLNTVYAVCRILSHSTETTNEPRTIDRLATFTIRRGLAELLGRTGPVERDRIGLKTDKPDIRQGQRDPLARDYLVGANRFLRTLLRADFRWVGCRAVGLAEPRTNTTPIIGSTMSTNTPNFIVLTEEDYSRLIDRIQQTIVDAIPSHQSASPLLVNSAEMARLLSISEQHLDRMRREGRIPSTTVGRSRRYCPQQVIEALR